MIRKILFSLLSLFYRKDESASEHEKSHFDVINSPAQKIKKDIKQKNKPVINAEYIFLKIKNNIQFLDYLIAEFTPHNEYKSYLIKLKDLHQQSTGCLRIIFKIKKSAPYYNNTLKTIYSHTKNIAELMNT